jgi:hypothetical protein
MSEIKPQYFGAVITTNMVTEKELKKLKNKAGGFVKCPTRKAQGSKNARWGQVGR